MKIPPGPVFRTPFGALRQLRRDRLGFLVQIAQTYGEAASLRALNRRIFLFNRPEYTHQILVEQTDKFHKGILLKRNAGRFIGQGLLTSEDDLHRKQRRLIQPAFHHGRVAAYGEVMVSYTQRMLDGWRDGEQRDIAHDMANLTMQIVTKTLFDADVENDAEQVGATITEGLKFVSENIGPMLPRWVPTPLNRRVDHMAAVIDRVIERIINERRLGDDKGDLLSMLLSAKDEHGQGMSMQQLHDEAITLFIAGHETTANALAWTLLLLAQNPDVEAKLMAELDAVLAGRTPSVADLARLPYLEWVVKESMRIYPPAWIVARTAMEEVQIGPWTVPTGSSILISPYLAHRDPAVFPDPEAFRPERFAEEDQWPRYAYFPFGGGPRVCIGNGFAMMEARLILATILPRYGLALAANARVALEPVVTLRPRHGIHMDLHARISESVLA